MTEMPQPNVINAEIGHPWLADDQPAVNADFSERVVMLPSATQWQATGFDGLDIRILEYVREGDFRLTAQLRTSSSIARSSVYNHTGLEALVQAGEISDQNNVFPAGLYLRNPASDTHTNPAEQLYFGTLEGDAHDDDQHGILFLSLGQFATSDGETRRINTKDESKWLPGPEEGTEVMPLHMHGTSNSMMVRWTKAATFTPRLDPLGEEILVLSGTLKDETGHFGAGSWIRNPLETWQSWSAEQGTVIYYKNGHFPAPAK